LDLEEIGFYNDEWIEVAQKRRVVEMDKRTDASTCVLFALVKVVSVSVKVCAL
jgi:hypothetical protein